LVPVTLKRRWLMEIYSGSSSRSGKSCDTCIHAYVSTSKLSINLLTRHTVGQSMEENLMAGRLSIQKLYSKAKCSGKAKAKAKGRRVLLLFEKLYGVVFWT
jgi:hypothetical protein